MEFHIPDRSYNQIAYTCCHSRTQKPFLVKAAQKKNKKTKKTLTHWVKSHKFSIRNLC